MVETFSEVEDFFVQRRKHGIKLGLERVTGLLKLLGNPERDVDAIHIAGTNGKGSTIQFLQNSLLASDYRVGVFTSPSFTGITGHFLVNGKQITTTEIIELLNNILPAIKKLDEAGNHPTEYEILTAMSFVYFNNNVDIALIETAMGGKEDTTNCFIPILSIITNVALDHLDYLGNTLEEITYHKAGIIKAKRPVIVGEVREESAAIILADANDLNAKVYFQDRDFHVNLPTNTVSIGAEYFQLSLKLQGGHQLNNAALILMALLVLEKQNYQIQWSESLEAINNTILPGRFELISQQPKIILDSAHNVAGIKAFSKTVETNYATSNKELIFTSFADKQTSEMIQELQKTFNHISLTTFEHPRAAKLRQLLSVTREADIIYLDNWQRKLSDVMGSDEDIVYFITGSMHFIMLVRNFIIEKQQSDL